MNITDQNGMQVAMVESAKMSVESLARYVCRTGLNREYKLSETIADFVAAVDGLECFLRNGDVDDLAQAFGDFTDAISDLDKVQDEGLKIWVASIESALDAIAQITFA